LHKFFFYSCKKWVLHSHTLSELALLPAENLP
jgi:hypothetical protein